MDHGGDLREADAGQAAGAGRRGAAGLLRERDRRQGALAGPATGEAAAAP